MCRLDTYRLVESAIPRLSPPACMAEVSPLPLPRWACLRLVRSLSEPAPPPFSNYTSLAASPITWTTARRPEGGPLPCHRLQVRVQTLPLPLPRLAYPLPTPLLPSRLPHQGRTLRLPNHPPLPFRPRRAPRATQVPARLAVQSSRHGERPARFLPRSQTSPSRRQREE